MQRILTLVFILSPFFVFSQQQQQSSVPKSIDPRLYAAYDKAYVDDVAQNDAFLLKRWTFYLDNAFFISETSLSKSETDESHSSPKESYRTVRIEDLEHINILKLEKEQTLVRDYYKESIYKISGTNKYLVYYSGQNFIQKLNDFLSEDKGLKK